MNCTAMDIAKLKQSTLMILKQHRDKQLQPNDLKEALVDYPQLQNEQRFPARSRFCNADDNVGFRGFGSLGCSGILRMN
jgi:hypothetical protein